MTAGPDVDPEYLVDSILVDLICTRNSNADDDFKIGSYIAWLASAALDRIEKNSPEENVPIVSQAAH